MIDHNNFSEALQKEVMELQEIRIRIIESLKKAPEGKLHVLHKAGRSPQYYCFLGKNQRKYISQKQLKTAVQLAQKEYDQKLLKIIEERIKIALQMVNKYKDSIEDVHSRLLQEKKALVTPMIPDEEDFLKNWYDSHPGGMNSYPFHQELFSDRGEQVRSKSEKILADLFNKYHVPYVYEPKIVLENGKVVCPDFLLLNRRLRKTIIFEHFGFMDDKNYAEKTCEKINLYQTNNFLQGDGFLFTMESAEEVLNTRIVVKLIHKFLL